MSTIVVTPPGGGRQRAAFDPLAVVAACVDVDVDGSRQQQRVAEVEPAPPGRSESSSMRPSRIVSPARTGRPPGVLTRPEIFSTIEIG